MSSADIQRTRQAVEGLGLTMIQPGPFRWRVLRDGELIAHWWPSSGKACDAAGRGQQCSTGPQLVAWLRDKLKVQEAARR